MKIKVLMAALVITLLMGVQGFASPCDSACVDPCVACDRAKCDLFSGLKKLVNGGARFNNCDPCEPVVACNPCDDAECNPCDVACDLPRIDLGKRLRNLFASSACCTPCDDLRDCNPCDVATDCDPCGDAGCCVAPKFRLRNLFKGFNRGCCDDGCNPCDEVGNCGPCDIAGDCDPCGNLCDTGCGPRGHLFDLPRISLKKLFGGFRGCCDDGGCNPCDEVRPCDTACCR